MKFSNFNIGCATCSYWTGNRTLSNDGRYITTDTNVKGSCRHPNCGNRSLVNKPAVWTCSGFCKWNAIK